MKEKVAIIILFQIIVINSFAQLPQHTSCGMDRMIRGGELAKLVQQNTAIESKYEHLHHYLHNIKALFRQPYAKYILRNIKNAQTASAHLQRINNNIPRVIALDVEFYHSIVTGQTYQKALLIFVLAHEIQHHTNGDLHYEENTKEQNYTKELLADEKAGYAVAKLTNVDINFFEEVLPKILKEDSESQTHPLIKYRLLASKAGWIKGKLEHNRKSLIYLSGKSYQRSVYKTGIEIWGESVGEKFSGICFEQDAKGNIYIGEKQNGIKQGTGFWIKPSEIGEELYYGEFRNNKLLEE